MANRESTERLPTALAILAAVSIALACGKAGPNGLPAGTAAATPRPSEAPISAFDADGTAYGFFPTPPEASLESSLAHFEAMARHADFVLFQASIPWEDFAGSVDGESQARTDIKNQVSLARANGMDFIFVVDPLNGLNRGEFIGLPPGWEANFSDSNVRAALSNFALWIAREYKPRYLGLASEINTYADAHPDDSPNYLSLYHRVYDRVKGEFPGIQVFVTFQWEDLNNVFPGAAEGRPAFQTNWDQVEAFEPYLDVWAISSYPYFVFSSQGGIPPDYYSPLLGRTEKPLAVAEGGYTSRPVGPISATPEDQVGYLTAIHDQIGARLAFWAYLLMDDLDMQSIGEPCARRAARSRTWRACACSPPSVCGDRTGRRSRRLRRGTACGGPTEGKPPGDAWGLLFLPGQVDARTADTLPVFQGDRMFPLIQADGGPFPAEIGQHP